MPIENLTPDIRNAVRAAIIGNDQVLLLEKAEGDRGACYALPGGAQKPGQTLAQALNQECLEEIDSAVEIAALMNVADHCKTSDTDPSSTRHLVEFLFRCTVPDNYVAQNGIKPDKSQTDVVRVNLSGLAAIQLYPESLSHWLPESILRDTATYLGIME